MGQAISARSAPVELVAQIGTDDGLGPHFHVLAWVDGTGTPAESVAGRFLPPRLDPDSGANPRPPSQAEKAGARLFEALFSGPLRRVWARAVEGARRAGGLRLVIRSDAVAVRMLPWELLYDRVLVQGHVALVDGWSVLRQVGQGPPPPPPPAHPSAAELHLSVLVAGDMGADSAQDLAVLLEAWPDGHVNLDSRATLRSIARSSAHVVHVVATGVPGANGWHSLALAADPGEPAGRAVTGAELLAAARSAVLAPELLVLAAADTDLLAADVAPAVPTVVGFRGRVSDAACIAFVRAFYLALAAGATVEEAAAVGRTSTLREPDAAPAEWALPVVYSTPAHRLMLGPQPAPATAGPAPVLESAPAPLVPVPGQDVEQLMAGMNVAALTARWESVPREYWPPIVREQHDRLRDRLPDVPPLQLVTR
jgi:hypothetical protein